MTGFRKYELDDPKDVCRMNKLFSPFGVSIEDGLFGKYILVDIARYERMMRSKAGRRSVITEKLRQKIFTMRSEHRNIREIAAETGVSKATVSKVLMDYEELDETDQLRLDI